MCKPVFNFCCWHQKPSSSDTSPGYNQSKAQTDGAVFVVHRQPIALDRFVIHDVRPPETAGWLQLFNL